MEVLAEFGLLYRKLMPSNKEGKPVALHDSVESVDLQDHNFSNELL